MFRQFKLTRLLCSGHILTRGFVLALLFIALICMFIAVPPVLIGYARHEPWSGSGLENVAFFTRNYRFSWQGFDHVPPAYFNLKDKLSQMEGCTAVSVDYADVLFGEKEKAAILCIYPVALVEHIEIPLSEGGWVSTQAYGHMPVLLDSRLRGDYSIGDHLNTACSWISRNEFTEVEREAVVVGFLTAENDHISTLGGSNAQLLQYFASKAMSGDPYIMITLESSFPDKPYTGDCTSTLLLPPIGESADSYIAAWREEITEWNLGQIDSYRDILNGDTWLMSILANVDFYFLTAWILALMVLSLIGFSIMQTETLQLRISIFELIGMSKAKVIKHVIIGCYIPIWIVNFVGIALGNLIALYMYADYTAVISHMTVISLAMTIVPHSIALAVDCNRIQRSNALQQWAAGR